MKDFKELLEGLSRNGKPIDQAKAKLSKLKTLKKQGKLKNSNLEAMDKFISKLHKDRNITSPEFEELEAEVGRLYESIEDVNEIKDEYKKMLSAAKKKIKGLDKEKACKVIDVNFPSVADKLKKDLKEQGLISEDLVDVEESKESIKVVKKFWDGAADLMKLLEGAEKKQFQNVLKDVDNILSMTDLRKD